MANIEISVSLQFGKYEIDLFQDWGMTKEEWDNIDDKARYICNELSVLPSWKYK